MRQERGSSMKKFTQQELKERLGFNADEVKLIMKAQREFPELLVEEDEKSFIIDGEKLCNQLGVKDNFNTWLLANSKSKQGKLIKYRMFENVDYVSDCEIANGCGSMGLEDIEKLSPQARSGLGIKSKITLTLNCAKKIAMRQNNQQGDLICDYFILMEKAVKMMRDWIVIREPQKAGYIEMCKMLNQEYRETHNGEESNNFLYSNNADMINLCLIGYKSKKIKQVMNLEYKDSLRDSLTAEFNKALYELQILNGNLVLSHIDFKTRRMIIQNTCTAKYMDLRTRVASEFHMEFKTIKED